MKASTTIKEMMAGNTICVPDYQRPYSWDTPASNISRNTQIDVFVSDLEEYSKSKKTSIHYYFGHFIFEKISEYKFAVIDGQQRLTTIVIFLTAIFARLEKENLTEEEQEEKELLYEDIIRRKSRYHFSTVNYDNQLLIDYVIKGKGNRNGLDTVSKKRMVNAYDHFVKLLEEKDKNYLLNMLRIVSKATCTTHQVKNESEAIQMFVFQNNRGKKPSHLDIIKAEFMLNIHLHGGDADRDELIKEVGGRFGRIYKLISAIEHKINEDSVLLYTARIYFNSLTIENTTDKIRETLSQEKSSTTEKPLPFIRNFTEKLERSFDCLEAFFKEGEKQTGNIYIHSLIALDRIEIAFPFIIKAYSYNLETEKIGELCSALEKLILRQRVIGTRARLAYRLDDEAYEKFTQDTPEIQPIVDRIEKIIKTTQENNPQEYNSWCGYWTNKKFEEALQGEIQHPVAKFLLWKYENHLKGQGYQERFDAIAKKTELEHIAPQTKKDQKQAEGYWVYEEGDKQDINCLGNYLLASKKHNCSMGNKPFVEKRATYQDLYQQRKIRKMTTEEPPTWTKEKIQERKKIIIKFILENL